MIESKVEFEQNKVLKKQEQQQKTNKPIKMSLDEFQKYTGKPDQSIPSPKIPKIIILTKNFYL